MSVPPIVFERLTGAQALVGYGCLIYPDRAEVILDMDERHHNRKNTLHGGLAAMMLDAACGFAVSRYYSEDASALVVTLSLTTNFIGSPKNGRLVTTARVVGAGRKIAYAEGFLRDATGAVMASATGVFKRERGESDGD